MKAQGFKIFILVLLAGFVACTPEKEPINYGNEQCAYCKMTIVDKRYGSEIVTQKGKVYKFDAVECMVNYIGDNQNNEKLAMKLVNTYNEPGKLHNASKSYFLRSKELPSPMGIFITPFTDKKAAGTKQEQIGGKIYSWESLNDQFEQFSKEKMGQN